MRTYVLTHLSDASLLRDLDALVAHERTATAVVLAHIAEVDARRLYLPAGFPSMYEYCVRKLRFSEDAAYKRIQAARAARRFTAIFDALAEGRLHLTGVGLLAPHLIPENVDELLAAAAHQTKADIEQLLAQRFPRTEWLALVQAIPAGRPVGDERLAPAQVEADAPGRVGALADQPAPALIESEALWNVRALTCQLAPAQVGAISPRSQVTPHAPGRFALQLTIGQATYEKLRYAQALLSHAIPSGDAAEIVDRALDTLIGQLEHQKFAATPTPRPRPGRPSASARHIPAQVKRAVWQRDQGQCTFLSETGQRCPARTRLETLWNDGLAVVGSCHLREERPTAWHEATLDRGLAPAAPEPHTKGARREHERYHLRGDGCTQAGDQRGDAAARTEPAGRVEAGQRARRDPETGEEAPARGAG